MNRIPESHRDLLDSPVVTLATIGPDGVPQVTATWFVVDAQGTIWLSLNTTRQKAKNLRRRPEATLFFLDLANPYRTLEIRARADVRPDPDYMLAEAIAAKYGGADVREMDGPGETRVAVAVEPTRVNTYG